jgi:hypothetical protein
MIFSHNYKDVSLSHSFTENSLAAAIYDYLICLIISLNFVDEKDIIFIKDKKQNSNFKDENKFVIICETLLEHLKLLINCEFMQIYQTERKLLEKIKKIGSLMKKYAMEELIKNIKFTTNEADNDTENYITSLELLFIILYNSKYFLGKDLLENIDEFKYENSNSKNLTYKNILNYVCSVAGNNTNRNCYIIGAFFSAILGFKNLGSEINNVFEFIPCLGYSVLEEDKLIIKIIKNQPENLIKYRPFMFSPGIIGLWVVYYKAKLDYKLNR